MKSFLSKNWKKLIYIITTILVILDIFMIGITKNTIIDDFYKYGPEYKKPTEVIKIDETKIKEEGEEVSSTFANYADLPDDLARGIVILAAGIIIILAISNIVEGSGSAPAKKK